MKTILITAYAINPSKGSEDGMGWNYVIQAARNNRVIAVTRRNNRTAIEQYISTAAGTNRELYVRISFLYFDWPKWMLFWKKGPMLSMIYYYMWQFSLACWLKGKKPIFDIAHNLNFHNDWTPSFLWMLGKPFVWGPVGHHPKIPAAFIAPYGKKELIKDRMLWILKLGFWNLDPFLNITKKRAQHTWCMHTASAAKLKLTARYFVRPSIAAPAAGISPVVNKQFTVLSIGRFVPLKGFDVTIRSFAAFYRQLSVTDKEKAKLVLIGKGPYKQFLQKIAVDEGVESVTQFLDWMPQPDLKVLYAEAGVFLFPSHEGAGMVVAEAMSYSLPVLCWDNAGPGTIVHPESALKIKYSSYDDSIRQFAQKLYDLFSDRSLYKREADLAQKRFTSSLDWNVKAKQLDAFYSKTGIANNL